MTTHETNTTAEDTHNWLEAVHEEQRRLRVEISDLRFIASALATVGMDKLARDITFCATNIFEANERISKEIGRMLVEEVDASQRAITETFKTILEHALRPEEA